MSGRGQRVGVCACLWALRTRGCLRPPGPPLPDGPLPVAPPSRSLFCPWPLDLAKKSGAQSRAGAGKRKTKVGRQARPPTSTGRRAHRTPAASAPWPTTRPGSLPGSLPGSGTGADLGPAHDLLPRSAFSSESKPRSLRLSSPPRPPVRARGPGLWRWPGAGPGQGANLAAAATMLGRARARASSLCPPAPRRSGPPPENFRDGVLLTKHSGLF